MELARRRASALPDTPSASSAVSASSASSPSVAHAPQVEFGSG
jgi:hypothetical protein